MRREGVFAVVDDTDSVTLGPQANSRNEMGEGEIDASLEETFPASDPPSFTSADTSHGGQETTLINLNTTFHHRGAIIVAPVYADPSQFQSGNPYGTSFTSNNGALKPDEVALAAARFQGRRAAEAALITSGGGK